MMDKQVFLASKPNPQETPSKAASASLNQITSLCAVLCYAMGAQELRKKGWGHCSHAGCNGHGGGYSHRPCGTRCRLLLCLVQALKSASLWAPRGAPCHDRQAAQSGVEMLVGNPSKPKPFSVSLLQLTSPLSLGP